MKRSENKISRREFFKRAGAGAAAVAAATACVGPKSPNTDNPSEPEGEMTYRQSPKGDKVSILGYGCMRWPTIPSDDGSDPELNQEAINNLVDYAIEHGVNYFDTAPMYQKGKSEVATGIALKRHPRNTFFVATKLSNTKPPFTKEAALKMYKASFKRLQVDYIDYYLLHNIGVPRDGATGISRFEERFLKNGVLEYLLKEREAGRIRNLGFSVHCDKETFDYVMKLHDKYHWDFVQIQMNYADWKKSRRKSNVEAEYMYNELEKRGIPVVVMEPLLGGSLANLPDFCNTRLQEREPEKTIASWAFRFCGSYPGILTVLSGMTYMDHLQDNLKSFSPLKPLTDEEKELLFDIAADYNKFPLINCTGCQYCMPCPYGLDIPGIFAHYNKCLNEGNLNDDETDSEYRKARRAFLIGYDRSVPRLRQAEMCVGCGKCEEACPQRIRISNQMRKIDKYAEKLRKTGKTLILALAALTTSLLMNAQPLEQANPIEQRYASYTSYCSPEKLFLHLDRTYYAIGETIFFDGYLQNASGKSILPLSNFIYVELLKPDGTEITRVKIKRNSKGDFPGNMEIPDNLRTGVYTIRAYTLWQMNGKPEYMFNETLKILGRSKPDPNDSKAKKKNVTATSPDQVDITFYPESGRYFCGRTACIGFKALKQNGQVANVSGDIITSTGEQVISVSTLHEGMGQFYLMPREGEHYLLRLDSGETFPVPEAATTGAVINMTNIPNYIMVSIATRSTGKLSLYLRNSSYLRCIHTTGYEDTDIGFRISRDAFTPGLNHFMLINDEGKIAADRLFYVLDDDAENSPVCNFTTSESKYEARELIKNKFTLTERDGFTPIDGTFSVSVLRGSFGGYTQNDDIISYLKLSSEIKGTINNPGYYFDKNVPLDKRRARVDLLTMIQGWKYYDLKTIFRSADFAKEIKYAKEYWQSISGAVSRAFSEKPPKNFYFTVFAPKLKATHVEPVIGECNRFLIDSLDFTINTGFFIEVDRMKTGLDYIPTWDGDKFAHKFAYKTAAWRFDRPEAKEKEAIPLQIDGMLVDTLEAAVVSASASNPFEEFFNSSRFSADLETFSQYTLLEYVLNKEPKFTFDTENMFNTMSGHTTALVADENTQVRHEEVKLIVDDMVQEWWMFEHIRLEDIKSIDISHNADPFYAAAGGYVAIKLKEGISLANSAENKPSRLYFVPLGYQPPQRFYSPRYDKGDTNLDFDHRNTIFWDFSVSTNHGAADVQFCNTDQMDYPYVVSINGLTKDGRPFAWKGTIINK